MNRVRLSTLLISLNVGLLLLAVTGVVFGATRLIERLADEQALARVEQVSASARLEIDDSRSMALTMAALLAERPTLQRLLTEEDALALSSFLEQFQQT